MVFKGKLGYIFENKVLSLRYGSHYASGNQKYDLPANNNFLSNKNVSIKSSKNNTIYCGDVFNFIQSQALELIFIKYSVINNQVLVLKFNLLNNLDEFFLNLNKSIDLEKLTKLKFFVKELKYPFTKSQKFECHKMARLVLKSSYCGFKIQCRLSSSNKRIQCVLNAPKLISEVGATNLDYLKLQEEVNKVWAVAFH